MAFAGQDSGAAWGLAQIVKAYSELADLLSPVHQQTVGNPPITIVHGTAAHLPGLASGSVDLVVKDPPYYNNVQYAELSDYFYVWQRRTLRDLYPEVFARRLTNKTDEAVANPARDGGDDAAGRVYERMMGEIFTEMRRVLKDEGLMTLMFTHKTQEAWEALTRAIIESGWDITASFPVESEGENATHQRDVAAAASSIFIACRKRPLETRGPSPWTGLGGAGVQQQVREAVREGLEDFAPLRLNPVDETVACYGRALHVLSRNWPVVDGDEPVTPIRAMNEASRVVAENQIRRITGGRLRVEDLDPESAMALTLFGIYGLGELPYDEALNLSRSLNIALAGKPGGYRLEAGDRYIGINQEAGGRGRSRSAAHAETGYHAPVIRTGSKLRLARPEERSPKRLEHPQTDWDVLHGILQAYRQGDTPVARAYLERHAKDRAARILDLLTVWAREVPDPELRREAETLRYGLG
jgi:adenine-specific DNA methylase